MDSAHKKSGLSMRASTARSPHYRSYPPRRFGSYPLYFEIPSRTLKEILNRALVSDQCDVVDGDGDGEGSGISMDVGDIKAWRC